ncbi:hypothetical protein EHV15_34395 [Paenibacillus oralis]|uniref:Uncharacterized protein n=1 Tax=Paenibacillus oralis TaxID=2490856 RepID=A0A3P3T9L8_9BACL|nr:hypothetical protein [Paenibacillus oralis]RRJ54690.1 hypothetical protein EHV15_34395 [Paenibacillus oralis]
MLQARIPSRFVGMVPGAYMVVGLSFKPEVTSSVNTGFGMFDFKFKIGDVDRPLDILSALQVSEQKILN